MKNIFFIGLALISFSCNKNLVEKNEKEENKIANETLQSVPARFSANSTDFAFDFWQKLHVEELAAKNYFVSPLSLHIALGMLVNGSDGITKSEIDAVLRLAGNQQENNEIYKKLIESLPKADSKVVNKIANSVWYRSDFTVEKPFLTDLQNYFLASVNAEDFSKTTTVDKINQWASDNTNAKIKKVLEEISPSQVMFLMNALYFKGDWKTPFDAKKTVETDFKNIDGTKISVKMMNMTEAIGYAERSNYQAIRLPYGSGNYSMTVILPNNEKTSLNDVLKNLNTTEWAELQKNLIDRKVVVQLPKFGMEYEIKLNKILSDMGMPTAFTTKADLSKISPPAGKLLVGFVKQNTFVAVDEVGTEAAAVTTIGIELTSAPILPEFIANRPFLFLISEKQSNTIMFVGKVSKL